MALSDREMEELNGNTGALPNASKPTNEVQVLECKSPASDSKRTSSTWSSTSTLDKSQSQSQLHLHRKSTSRQTIQSPVSSPHRNPENNYYRQPGCRVSRRVSILKDTGSYYRDNSLKSPISRSRKILETMRTRIQFPTISLDYKHASRKIISRGTGKLSFFPSRALLMAEGRRDYSTRGY